MSKETKKETPWDKFKKKNPEDRTAKPWDLLNPHLRVDEAIAKERLEICKACPNFQITKTCSICHCFMPEKTKLANASCPDNPPRWDRVEVKV